MCQNKADMSKGSMSSGSTLLPSAVQVEAETLSALVTGASYSNSINSSSVSANPAGGFPLLSENQENASWTSGSHHLHILMSDQTPQIPPQHHQLGTFSSPNSLFDMSSAPTPLFSFHIRSDLDETQSFDRLGTLTLSDHERAKKGLEGCILEDHVSGGAEVLTEWEFSQGAPNFLNCNQLEAAIEQDQRALQMSISSDTSCLNPGDFHCNNALFPYGSGSFSSSIIFQEVFYDPLLLQGRGGLDDNIFLEEVFYDPLLLQGRTRLDENDFLAMRGADNGNSQVWVGHSEHSSSGLRHSEINEATPTHHVHNALSSKAARTKRRMAIRTHQRKWGATPSTSPKPKRSCNKRNNNNCSLHSRQSIPPSPVNINNIEVCNRSLRFLLEKNLRKSDVGSLGRIVLPKKYAEANLPPLPSKEGMTIEMEDLETSKVWKLRFRFWPNNKSKMYVLENTGKFAETHKLDIGDYMIIYEDQITGKKVIAAKKATREQPQSSQDSESNDVYVQNAQRQNSENEDADRALIHYSNVDSSTPTLSSEVLPPLISKPKQDGGVDDNEDIYWTDYEYGGDLSLFRIEFGHCPELSENMEGGELNI